QCRSRWLRRLDEPTLQGSAMQWPRTAAADQKWQRRSSRAVRSGTRGNPGLSVWSRRDWRRGPERPAIAIPESAGVRTRTTYAQGVAGDLRMPRERADEANGMWVHV